ncbi:uncharacterized protein [Montipora foliosa]|uniref:uncharacterized protein isoform X1 n=1 Tax=Montipora foliosa TaxID=591990 RepID=UPI0035F20B88
MNPYPCERTFTLLPGQLMWNCSSLRGYRRFSCLPKTVSLASDPLGFCHVKKEGESKSGTISASLKIVASSHQEENSPTDNQLVHINDLLYNGFYCFEMISERSLDDVVCGVCGICPEICLGDGNEKNCCSNSQIYYTKTDEPKKDMISLSEFLSTLRTRWLEPIVYTKIAKPFSVSVEEIPPLIPTLLIYLERKFATLNVTKRVSTWNLVQNLQQPSTSNSFSSLKSIAAQAVATAGLSNPVPAPTDYSSGSRALLGSSSSQTTDENKVVQETNTAHLQPLLGVAPLGPVPLNKERCYQLAMLEAAYHHLPLPADSEKVRPFLPRNQYPTPAHHHQHPPQHVDSIEFFQRLSTETLFFIFYYQEVSFSRKREKATFASLAPFEYR